MRGIDAARSAGLAVRINTVAMRGVNDGELPALLAWCGERGFDLALIEAMPRCDASLYRHSTPPDPTDVR